MYGTNPIARLTFWKAAMSGTLASSTTPPGSSVVVISHRSVEPS